MEKVIHGNDSWNMDLANQTVGGVLKEWRSLFNIPEGARIEVNGQGVNHDYVLKAGDTLEAVRETGSKG